MQENFKQIFYQDVGTYTWPEGTQYTALEQDSKAIGKSEYRNPNLGVSFVGMADEPGVHMRYKVNFP